MRSVRSQRCRSTAVGFVGACRPCSVVDPQRIRMAYSLLFSLPGTPVLFYGEEIGMGENLGVEGRMAVRTPMQWSDERERGSPPPIPRGSLPRSPKVSSDPWRRTSRRKDEIRTPC